MAKSAGAVAADAAAGREPSDEGQKSDEKTAAQVVRREIPGNLPYLTATGTLKRVLDKIVEAQRPEKFTVDFLENVLKATGGAARASIPILKRMGFLTSDGTPTELYAKFKTEGGRGQAALLGLRNAFVEIFKRSEYAHAADDDKVRDIIVEITGLQKNDKVAAAIKSTFNVIRSYIPKGTEFQRGDAAAVPAEDTTNKMDSSERSDTTAAQPRGVGLNYNINIVLPETADIKVLNAIFRSVKENLLQ